MLFNSYIFLFAFLPAVWLLHRLAASGGRRSAPLAVLVGGSLVFYSYWKPAYAPLLVASIGFNYALGRWALRPDSARAGPWLALGVAANLGLLGYFKYAGFFIGQVGAFSQWTGAGVDPIAAATQLALPLGISFYTFQQIAYLVDRRRGEAEEHSFLHYALFVSFFPQLIAGPIVHHKEVMPQFRAAGALELRYRNVYLGLGLLSLGLFKKVVIADTLSPWAGECFDAADPTPAVAWTGVLAYTLQIYFDFSGYTDMALGLGRLFNIELPQNFDSPYKARSIIDFWRRWHMTLSRFLRDYLYIPLGGNRRGRARRYVNLMLTMLLGGLWHGAGWTFVFWGGLHGALLCVAHAWRRFGSFTLPGPLSWALTFGAVAFGWVFFRAPSFEAAIGILHALAAADLATLGAAATDTRGLLILALIAFCALAPNSLEWMLGRGEEPGPIGAGVRTCVTAVAAAVAVLLLTRPTEFLYFQF